MKLQNIKSWTNTQFVLVFSQGLLTVRKTAPSSFKSAPKQKTSASSNLSIKTSNWQPEIECEVISGRCSAKTSHNHKHHHSCAFVISTDICMNNGLRGATELSEQKEGGEQKCFKLLRTAFSYVFNIVSMKCLHSHMQCTTMSLNLQTCCLGNTKVGFLPAS